MRKEINELIINKNMVKIYRKGNSLYFELSDGRVVSTNTGNVDASPRINGSDTIWYFNGVDDVLNNSQSLLESEIFDKNGVLYSDFSQWIADNTGTSSTGPGSSAVLPIGASTEAKQDTQITSLSSIDTKLDSAKTFKELQYKVSIGDVSGRLFLKSGRNPNITSASAPEDMWNGSSIYTGFPSISEEFTITCGAGDVGGSVTFVYLASFTSTTYLTHTTVLTGTTTNTGITGIRCHTAFFSSASGSGFNTTEIIMRHRTTVANIFFRMPIGRSQTYLSCATIPYNNKGYLWDLFAGVYGTTNVSAEMVMNIGDNGASPRLRRNFIVSNAYTYQDKALNDSPIVLNSTSGIIDVSLRILSTTSASATTLVGGFNLLIIPNT